MPATWHGHDIFLTSHALYIHHTHESVLSTPHVPFIWIIYPSQTYSSKQSHPFQPPPPMPSTLRGARVHPALPQLMTTSHHIPATRTACHPCRRLVGGC